MEHVLDYKKQFKIQRDPTRKLLLAPKNECGKRKFICTTIRPTKLPFTELYEWDQCAAFLADFIEYEELSPPNKLPSRIPSPYNVLQWQAGDSFDTSIVLCSLLIGAGYDAYCVYGSAPKFITTNSVDKNLNCPFDLNIDEEEKDDIRDPDEELMKKKEEVKVKPVEDFKIPQKPALKSSYVEKKENEEDRLLREQYLKENTIDDDAPELEKRDELEKKKQRLHCWVLLRKGHRTLSETFFIEPTTGRKYSLADAPYQCVEAVFNDKNFWINMDTSRPVNDLSYDTLDDLVEWEYVMIEGADKRKNDEEDMQQEEEEAGSAEEEEAEEILDMPPPWSQKLHIDKDKFLSLCPNGEKTVFYRKCKIDFYAPCTQVDGLVKRITIYDDYKRHLIKEIRSYFKNRRDKLVLRRRFPYEFKLIEHYDPSDATNYWKKLI